MFLEIYADHKKFLPATMYFPGKMYKISANMGNIKKRPKFSMQIVLLPRYLFKVVTKMSGEVNWKNDKTNW